MCQRADKRESEAQNMRNLKLKIRNHFPRPQTVGRPNSQFAIRNSQSRLGFTLVEVLIVVAILAVVAAGLVGLSSYLQTQNNTVLTEKCLELLSTAVAEFYDITAHFPIDDWGDIGADGSRIAGASKSGDNPNSDELLYLQLSLLPQTRQIISKLPEKLLASPLSEARVQLAHDLSANTPYLRSIVDPWGEPLHYDASGSFPRIWSSGPDGIDDDGGGDDI